MAKPILIALLLTALCSCGPIQGYPGPERPVSEIAVVSRNCLESGLSDVSIDGLTFCLRDITLLPGKHLFYAARTDSSDPYDCETHEEFDSSGYDSCLSDREADIRKGKSSPRNCESSWYEKSVTTCSVDYVKYRCGLISSLAPGLRYRVKGHDGAQGREIVLYRGNDQDPLAAFDCVQMSAWSQRDTR